MIEERLCVQTFTVADVESYFSCVSLRTSTTGVIKPLVSRTSSSCAKEVNGWGGTNTRKVSGFKLTQDIDFGDGISSMYARSLET